MTNPRNPKDSPKTLSRKNNSKTQSKNANSHLTSEGARLPTEVRNKIPRLADQVFQRAYKYKGKVTNTF